MTLSSSFAEQSVFVEAAGWIQGVLLGALGTSIAVIAVAWLGFEMLFGRLDLRSGARVLMGCFIMFGAVSIAQGIMEAVRGTNAGPVHVVIESSPAIPPPAVGPSRVDPYAGASVPM